MDLHGQQGLQPVTRIQMAQSDKPLFVAGTA